MSILSIQTIIIRVINTIVEIKVNILYVKTNFIKRRKIESP